MSSSEFHHYTRDEFLAEFYPDPVGKAAIAAGMERLRAEQRAFPQRGHFGGQDRYQAALQGATARQMVARAE